MRPPSPPSSPPCDRLFDISRKNNTDNKPACRYTSQRTLAKVLRVRQQGNSRRADGRAGSWSPHSSSPPLLAIDSYHTPHGGRGWVFSSLTESSTHHHNGGIPHKHEPPWPKYSHHSDPAVHSKRGLYCRTERERISTTRAHTPPWPIYSTFYIPMITLNGDYNSDLILDKKGLGESRSGDTLTSS